MKSANTIRWLGFAGALLVALLEAAACEQVTGADFSGLTRRGRGAAADASTAAGTNGSNGGTDGAAGNDSGSESRAASGGSDDAGASAGGGSGSAGGLPQETGASGASNDSGRDAAEGGGASGGASDAGVVLGRQLVRPKASVSNGSFGRAVALADQWALVSSMESVGIPQVFLLERLSGGVWDLNQELHNPGSAINVDFGAALALTEAWAVIGAPGFNHTAGEVFFFAHEAKDTWAPRDRVRADQPEAGDYFGLSIAIEGTTVAIGSPLAGKNGGAVYIYRHRATWERWQKIVADTQWGDGFGGGLALEGNTLVACAVGDDTKGDTAGAAYVFELAGDTWRQREKLLPTEAGVRGFCSFAALQGNTLVIGAVGSAGGGNAYVYSRDAGGSFESRLPQLITPPAILVKPEGFGVAGAICGSTVAIGHEGGDFIGDISVFRRSSGRWTFSENLRADATVLSGFGRAIACRGTTLAAGDFYDNAAYFYELSP